MFCFELEVEPKEMQTWQHFSGMSNVLNYDSGKLLMQGNRSGRQDLGVGADVCRSRI